jgi:DNA-binding NtrC family response regulator
MGGSRVIGFWSSAVPSRKTHVLVATAEPGLLRALEGALAGCECEVVTVSTSQELMERVERDDFDLALVDSDLAAVTESSLVGALAARSSGLKLVAIVGAGDVARGIQAVRHGAFDFLRKPIDASEVRYVVGKGMASSSRFEEEPPASSFAAATPILGHSSAIRKLKSAIKQVASGTATVLIRGESGTGKELVARQLHDQSTRARGPFVKVHCGALPDNLLESELFGYERGAFTGAVARKPGRVELAAGGTLFLDEIGDITPVFQLKLLRLLQDREYELLGSTETCKADVRFITATHRDLESMVAKGEFRADLFYRLNVVSIVTPALRDRLEDLESLAIHLCHAAAVSNGRRPIDFDVAALDLLKRQKWPGNVRQLQHFIERLVVLSSGPRISEKDVQSEIARLPGAIGLAAAMGEGPHVPKDSSLVELRAAIRKAERRALEKAILHTNGNRDAMARVLGISRRALFYKLREHGM